MLFWHHTQPGQQEVNMGSLPPCLILCSNSVPSFHNDRIGREIGYPELYRRLLPLGAQYNLAFRLQIRDAGGKAGKFLASYAPRARGRRKGKRQW